MQATRPKVSILIKALNEERHIASCLNAALREAATVNGEVILVDSLSSDRTLDIAKQFQIRIVQFINAEDRGCSAAVQLGYQHAEGDFIYVLDADMELMPGFLETALAALTADPALAGVGGKLLDIGETMTAYDRRRSEAEKEVTQPVSVDELGGGGLYRRAAIESAGYLAHRGLPAFEEAELGMRLRSAGWRLLRLPAPAVRHHGHRETNRQMFSRLWRNRRAHATGMLLRSALGTPWWWRACRKQWFLFATLALHLFTLVAASVLPLPGGISVNLLICEIAAWAGLVATLALHKRSLRSALLSVVSWHYFLFAALASLGMPLTDPHHPIPFRRLI